jgi:hypothetical protein
MGPYNHANATIGRAYGLLSQNLQGGSVPDDTYMGSLGNWLAYTAVFPEAEERSPWQPLHVQKGYKRLTASPAFSSAAGTRMPVTALERRGRRRCGAHLPRSSSTVSRCS